MKASKVIKVATIFLSYFPLKLYIRWKMKVHLKLLALNEFTKRVKVLHL